MKFPIKDTVIVIPTKRSPPVLTLESFTVPRGMNVLLVCDPDVLKAHQRCYRGQSHVFVVRGKRGIVAQARECYTRVLDRGYTYGVRLDDDLPQTSYVLDNRTHPSLSAVITWLRQCVEETQTSLAGLCNTSRVDWLGKGFGRSYALVHGGTQMFKAMDPDDILPADVTHFEDIWRSCSHRARDGAVGRVAFCGMNKMASQQLAGTTVLTKEKVRLEAAHRIAEEWDEYVVYEGRKTISGGKISYHKFRFRRHPEFRSKP